MNWERAKNLTLIFFVLLNLLLLYLTSVERGRYTLSAEQERALTTVFTQNRISMYSKIIRQYPPMRPLMLAGYYYDTDALLAMFFPDPAQVTHLLESDREVFTYQNQELSISNGYVTYENPAVFDSFRPVDPETALRLCDEFISKYYPDYRLEAELDFEYGLRLCYRQFYQKKYLIHTNFIEFWVTGDGIGQVDMQYGTVIGLGDGLHDICSPDEALLTFIQRIRNLTGEAPVFINRMDIVYYQEEYSAQENVPLRAIPFYRIFVDNHVEPFLVNAYYNQIL